MPEHDTPPSNWNVRLRLLDVLGMMTVLLLVCTIIGILPLAQWVLPGMVWLTMLAMAREQRSTLWKINAGLWTAIFVMYILVQLTVLR